MKRITLCNCLCSSPSSSCSRFSASLIRNIGEFGAKNYFTDHWTVNTIQLFALCERKLFWSILFQNKSQRRVISYRLLDRYSHLFICTSLKETLSSGQKPVYTFKTKASEQIAFAAVFYFGQVFGFCKLINKSVLEWFLLIMCKYHTLNRSTTLFSRDHPTLMFLIKKRRSADNAHYWTTILSN